MINCCLLPPNLLSLTDQLPHAGSAISRSTATDTRHAQCVFGASARHIHARIRARIRRMPSRIKFLVRGSRQVGHGATRGEASVRRRGVRDAMALLHPTVLRASVGGHGRRRGWRGVEDREDGEESCGGLQDLGRRRKSALGDKTATDRQRQR